VRYSVLLPAAVADTDSAAVQYWVDTVWEDEDGLVVVRDQWYPKSPNQDHLTMMFVTFHIISSSSSSSSSCGCGGVC